MSIEDLKKFNFFPHEDVVEMGDLLVDTVAFVTSPANERKFVLMKSEKKGTRKQEEEVVVEEEVDAPEKQEEVPPREGQDPEKLTVPEFRTKVIEVINRLHLGLNNTTNIPDMQVKLTESIAEFSTLASVQSDKQEEDEQQTEEEEPATPDDTTEDEEASEIDTDDSEEQAVAGLLDDLESILDDVQSPAVQ